MKKVMDIAIRFMNKCMNDVNVFFCEIKEDCFNIAENRSYKNLGFICPDRIQLDYQFTG